MENARAAVARVNVLGVGVSAINLEQARSLVLTAAVKRQKGYVAVTGVHGICEALDDVEFRQILNRAFLVTPDGMPLTWIGRHYGHVTMDRVYGPDLMELVMKSTRDGSLRHFLYGGKDGVAEHLKRELEERFRGVRITGTYSPPFRPLTGEEEMDLMTQIQRCGVDILWVGLSTPKQERFMADYTERLDCSLMIGVGAAFDFFTGRVSQAPRWVQRSGLEWLFRLIQEPRRLWRRYVRNNPRFVLKILVQMSGGQARGRFADQET